MTSNKRALGVIRLSELTDETTSPQRQREIITRKAADRHSRIIGWAEDLDVSAFKIPPAKRPQIAKWLARASEYDEIIFWKTDRFVRRLFPDFADMVAWSLKHDVVLVSAEEQLDLSGPMGRGYAAQLATFAEMESANTSMRVKGAHEYLRRNKRWGGGRSPYGYKIIDNPDGAGKVLAVNGMTADIVREAVRRVIAGESVNSIATDFSERRIPSPHMLKKPAYPGAKKAFCLIPRRWQDTSLRLILKDKAMLGHVVHDGMSVLGDDGMPLICAEPLVSADDWVKLQARLDITAIPNKRKNDPAMLRDIARCGLCEAPLYQWVKHQKGRAFSYYRCRYAYTWKAGQEKRCGAPLINAGKLDAVVDDMVMAYADQPDTERVIIPGDDHGKQLAGIRQAINSVTAEWTSGRRGDDEYDKTMRVLRAERDRLAELPNEPDRVVVKPTGKTRGEVWLSLDSQGKRRYLVNRGIKVYAHRDGGSELIVTAGGGELFGDILEGM